MTVEQNVLQQHSQKVRARALNVLLCASLGKLALAYLASKLASFTYSQIAIYLHTACRGVYLF